MKNYADLGGCYPPQPSASADNTLLDLHNSSYHTQPHPIIANYSDNCAVLYNGAWWYEGCHHSNLNGLYHHGKHSSSADGVNWYHWKGHNYSAKRAEMKIKPVKFQ